jgi:hypothetical protein
MPQPGRADFLRFLIGFRNKHFGKGVLLQTPDQIVKHSFPAAKVSEPGLDGASHLGGASMDHGSYESTRTLLALQENWHVARS